MSGFHEVQFPLTLSYGSSGGMGFNTQIIESDSAQEQRLVRWSVPRRQYRGVLQEFTKTDIASLIDFYIARQGAAFGFRYKDFADFTTATDHQSAHSNTDIQIGVGDGSNKVFQLIKQYISTPTTVTRNITKPIASSLKVSLNDVDQPSGWTVDSASGVLTFTTAPSNTVSVKAGFEFDVPVRFAVSSDTHMSIVHAQFDNLDVSVDMVEILDITPVRDKFDHGSAYHYASATSTTMSIANGVVWLVDPASALIQLTLPVKTSTPLGGAVFIVKNVDTGIKVIQILDDDGTTVLANIDPQGGVTVVLGLDSGGSRAWYVL